MAHAKETQPDFGTGQKNLRIYIIGVVLCVVLTLISFGSVMSGHVSKLPLFIIIYVSACVQFFVQVICFLRLNTQTEQARMNVMAFLFTAVILLCVVAGSLWIMSNLNYNMMN